MSNSSLVSYTKISPNKTSPRNHKIDTITIHCMAFNGTVETCGRVFAAESRKASSNYGIGSDGRIALYVDEKDRSWCSSNAANDHRAITIEVANDGGAPDWHVSDKALDSLIKLCADICKRNGIKKLIWKGDKSLIGQVSKQNMTVHRWFAAKACPGDYLYNLHPYIVKQVNAKLTEKATTPAKVTYPACPFKIKVKVKTAYLASASSSAKVKGYAQPSTYTITQVSGNYGKLKSGAGWILLNNTKQVEVIKSSTTATTSTPKKSITEIAKEVWAGKWGNGAERKKKLEAAGYDYNKVQAEIQRLYY